MILGEQAELQVSSQYQDYPGLLGTRDEEIGLNRNFLCGKRNQIYSKNTSK